MILHELEKAIEDILHTLGIQTPSVLFDNPTDFKNGDVATNVAMVYAKELGMKPKELAEKIAETLRQAQGELPDLQEVRIAGAGFINFYFSKQYFQKNVEQILKQGNEFGKNKSLSGKKIMIEYTQPNPFKPFHIGHLMSNAIGESISRIVEFSGADLIRVNYQGDVGLHVAKALYGILKKGKPDPSLSIAAQAHYIGECYVFGSSEYEKEGEVKEQIDRINKEVYERSDSLINELYDQGRKVTLEAFEEIYTILGTKFAHYFFESDAAVVGKKVVLEGLKKGIFEKSDGAIVFKAEKLDPKLHTRVFITSQGLPTYDAKEIGLAELKFEKETNLDLSITTTATEQLGVIGVAYEAIYQVWPQFRGKLKHVTHGMMRFASGKMSSRKGNVITGESLLADTKERVLERMQSDAYTNKEIIAEQITVAALKYSILRSSAGSDIVYDPEHSISFEGDSGPYLQYTAVRAKSILAKVSNENTDAPTPEAWETKNVERLLATFPEVVAKSLELYQPHHIATYLIELASAFNSFYAAEKIIDEEDPSSPYRIQITRAFYTTIQNGLYLLGIAVPEKM